MRRRGVNVPEGGGGLISFEVGGYPLPPWVRGVGGGCLLKNRKGGGGMP
jgi:hypothetical protein